MNNIIFIIDLPSLTTFTTATNSFFRTSSLILESIWLLLQVIFIIDLPSLTTLTTGSSSFYNISSLILESI